MREYQQASKGSLEIGCYGQKGIRDSAVCIELQVYYSYIEFSGMDFIALLKFVDGRKSHAR